MVKKAMAVSMLTVLAFIFSGVNVAYGQVPVFFDFIRDFRLFDLDGKEIHRNEIIEIRPARAFDLRLHVTHMGQAHIMVTPDEYGFLPPPPMRTSAIAPERDSQMGGRLQLYYSPTTGLLTLMVHRTDDDLVMQDLVTIQIVTLVDGYGGLGLYSTIFPIRVKITNAGNARDDGNSGGTCNVAGFGFLALLLLPPVFLWKKRK